MAIAIAAVVTTTFLVASTGTPSPSPSPSAGGGQSSSTIRPNSSVTPVAGATTLPTTDPPTPPLEPTHPPTPPTPSPPGPDYLLISRGHFFSLPTAGPAWEALLAVADGDLGSADLTDRDNKHAVQTLAMALVYARTRDDAYREKARAAIMGAIGTERDGAQSSILALGRQLASYVLAADFIELSDDDDEEFRDWLAEIRTRELGGHGRWKELTATHADSTNNWGAFAGASRIAASLYLGDTADVDDAAQVLRGFLGDRVAWSQWQDIDRTDASWACDREEFTPVNPPCSREGIDLDGAIVTDISRGGRLRWPPRRDGILYTTESLQGLALQAELLQMAGYDPWEWGDQALLRAAHFLDRADGWNETSVSYHVAWIFNARYPLSLPTMPAGYGRLLGYTDWLYATTYGAR